MSYIACPSCGHRNAYDPEEQDYIACEACDQLIFTPERDNAVITWTPGPSRPDGRRAIKADVANYRITIYDQGQKFTWIAYTQRTLAQKGLTSFASDIADDQKEAKLAALRAVQQDIEAQVQTAIIAAIAAL